MAHPSRRRPRHAWALAASACLLLTACRHPPQPEGGAHEETKAEDKKAPERQRPGDASPQAPARKDILARKKKLYSQHDEEVIIRDFFQDRREGFFLDVGCAGPRKDSNTYYL